MSHRDYMYKGIGIGIAIGTVIGMLIKKMRRKRPSYMVKHFLKKAGAIVCLLGDAFGF